MYRWYYSSERNGCRHCGPKVGNQARPASTVHNESMTQHAADADGKSAASLISLAAPAMF